MRHLTVYRRFFTQSDCYKADVTSRLVGVQVHSTGANNAYLRRYVQPDDGRRRWKLQRRRKCEWMEWYLEKYGRCQLFFSIWNYSDNYYDIRRIMYGNLL